MMPSYVSSHIVKKCHCCSLFNATLKIFHIFVLFVGGLLFKIAPLHSGKVPSCVPKHLTESICVLDKFYLGMSYSAVSFEFNVNESVTCIQ